MNITALLQKEQIQFLFLPKQMDYSTGDVDLYNLLHTEKINACWEKVLFYIEGKLVHQISDFLWAI